MGFESLTEKLQGTLKRLRGQTRVTDKDVKEFMREIRMAFLEADVNYKVVKEFIKTVSEKAVGTDVLESLTPGQQIVKIVHEELIALMGSKETKLSFSASPSVIMMVGLQGAGKTTASAKIAQLLKKQGKKPMMVACDIYRPAAVKQLEVLGSQLSIPVFSREPGVSAVNIAKESIKFANSHMHDVVIIDTAGRLHINEELMKELEDIKAAVKPGEILLVVDAMTGQDAVNVAEAFDQKLDISGVVLSKLDGDTRGGAALSVRAVTGKPIKFASTGEKTSDIEVFYPERMASRILGMGDVLSLIEKAQEAFDEKSMGEMEKRLKTQNFTLDDFLSQMQQVKKMGGISGLMAMMPGLGSKVKEEDLDSNKLVVTEAVIQSMTRKERINPNLLNASRRKRIAAGSGTTVQSVNTVLKEFEEMKKMMKMFMGSSGKFGKKGLGNLKLPF